MIMIIDLNNLAHRCFHTPQGVLTTKAGEPSGVMLGVMNSIKGLLDKFPETTKVLVCFDGGKSRWRKELYPAYKAQRDYGKDDPEKAKAYEGLWQQIKILYEFLPKLGLNTIQVEGQEADDCIAAACKMVTDTHKLIVSGDKDMLQLVNENTSVYVPHKDRVITPLNFYEEMGVPQVAWVGYRALLGDASDNMPGVPGIGDVTAKNLMNTYGHIDKVLNAVGDDKKKLMKSTRTKRIFEPQNLQILGLNNKLMSFKFIQIEELEPAIREELDKTLEVDSPAVRDFCMRWQYASILSGYLGWILAFKSLG